MITVNFDAVDNNIFTLVERTVEVNFGGATYEAGSGTGSTVAAVIPSVNADISDYTEITLDAFQDFGGNENADSGYFELDVDTAPQDPKTIYKLEDDDSSIGEQYNFQNVELNTPYYFRLGGAYSFEENPQVGYGSIYAISINGAGLAAPLVIPIALDNVVSEGTVFCFIVTETPTDANLSDVVLFSYYKDDFRLLPSSQSDGVIFSNFGRKVTIDNAASLSLNAGKLSVNWTEGNAGLLKFASAGLRSNQNGIGGNAMTEEQWLVANMGIEDRGQIGQTVDSLILSWGIATHTLTDASYTITTVAAMPIGTRGKLLLTPAGFAHAIDATRITVRPGSDTPDTAASLIVCEYECYEVGKVIMSYTNIA